jgi:catechol 2,3-dioxygenase-like lactoylglutathione lyase family enzyme
VSYFALVTDRYEEVGRFYGEQLGFPVVEEWDRANARGCRFDVGGVVLEIIDNRRERPALRLGEPADRFHLAVEVDDIEEARRRVAIDAPPARATSWGATVFRVRDPDGIPVTFLQRTNGGDE